MILVVGSINQDIVLKTEKIPHPGETVLALSSEKNAGGKGANQAVACSRCGAEVMMLGCVGNDEAGEMLLESMQASGVNTENILYAECGTSKAYICVSSSGENSIVVDSEANRLVSPQYLRDHEDCFEKAEYCILQREIPDETVREARALCRKHQVKIVWNPSPVEHVNVQDLMGVDTLVPNEHEAEILCGRPVDQMSEDDWNRFLDQYQIGNLVLTLGDQGCLVIDKDRNRIRIPAMKCHVVDTTGAGDTFLGALAACLAEGEGFERAARFANVAGALQCTRAGAQKAMPDRDEIEDHLKDRQERAA